MRVCLSSLRSAGPLSIVLEQFSHKCSHLNNGRTISHPHYTYSDKTWISGKF